MVNYGLDHYNAIVIYNADELNPDVCLINAQCLVCKAVSGVTFILILNVSNIKLVDYVGHVQMDYYWDLINVRNVLKL